MGTPTLARSLLRRRRKKTMFGVRNKFGDVVCIMRRKSLAIEAAEQLTGRTWAHLKSDDGCGIVRVKVDVDTSPEVGCARSTPGYNDLWGCFDRGQGFMIFARSLAHEMPDDWQSRLAELIQEWESTWDFPDDFPVAYVSARNWRTNRFTRWPAWLIQYKYRNREAIDALRAKEST